MPLLNSQEEEIVEDDGDNRPGPSTHQHTVSAAPRFCLALCCSALTGAPSGG